MEAQSRRLLILPVATVPEVLENPQLEARGYWRSLPVGGREARHPGPSVRFSAWSRPDDRPAPPSGANTDEVLAEPVRPAPPAPADPPRTTLPLEGLKILDFMWVMAGPAATRVLADYGATVIRVETPSRPGAGRSMAPFRGGQFAPQNSLFFDNMNAGKLGLALNLGCEEGRRIARDLVKWADVVAESFAPRAFRGWGLDYDSLRQIKPDLIMVSSCLFGQDGPLSDVSGFGTMGAAVSTFIDLTGYPDRSPAGPFSAYTDTIAPRLLLAGLLAALDHRRRTGKGQYIDHSQVESSVQFVSPYLLDYQLNGRALTRMGNRDPDMAPHGVYPSRGDDDWVAIAVRDDGDWLRLCAVIERPDLAGDARLEALAGRLTAQDELDAAISAWTAERLPAEAEAALQAGGIPAHAVIRASNAVDDPQLTHRGHIVRVPHSLHGESVVEGSRFRLSRTPARIGQPPAVGEHTEQILKEILGYDDEHIADLAAAGAFD
ncbi:MAG: CoA transferase [Dehalococcoidia bacterium]|nr:CoA transferase [Dehalococcoidia bacterium]